MLGPCVEMHGPGIQTVRRARHPNSSKKSSREDEISIYYYFSVTSSRFRVGERTELGSAAPSHAEDRGAAVATLQVAIANERPKRKNFNLAMMA